MTTPARKFVLTSGRYARFENGHRKEYRAGDTITLTEEEAKRLSSIVEPASDPVTGVGSLRHSVPPQSSEYYRSRRFRARVDPLDKE